MPSERKRIAVVHHKTPVGKILAEKVFHHHERLFVGNDRRVFILFAKGGNVRRMVGLHMLDDKVVGLFSAERVFDIRKPLFSEPRVYGVGYGDFLVLNNVRIISHSVWYDVLPLEKVDGVVVHTDVNDVLRDIH